MIRVLIRLAFIKSTQACFLLLVPLLVVQSSQGESGFVATRVLESLPLLVLGLIGGVLIDRVGANRVNKIALFVYMAPPLLLLAVHAHKLPEAALLLASLSLSAISQLLQSCGDRVVLDLVDASRLPKYNATSILIDRFCSLCLPPLVGALAVWNLQFALTLAVGMAGVGSIALSLMSPGRGAPEAQRIQQVSVFRQLRIGFATLTENRFLFQLVLIAMLVNGLESIPIAYAFLYAHDGLHMNLAEIGLLASMSGAGGLIAASLARRLRGSKRVLLWIFVGTMASNAVVYGSVYALDNKYALLAGKALEAFGFVFSAVSYRTLRLESTDKALFGTISGAVGFTVKCCVPLCILLAGALLAWISPRDLYLTTGIAEMLLACGVAVWVRRQRVPAEPQEAFA